MWHWHAVRTLRVVTFNVAHTRHIWRTCAKYGVLLESQRRGAVRLEYGSKQQRCKSSRASALRLVSAARRDWHPGERLTINTFVEVLMATRNSSDSGGNRARTHSARTAESGRKAGRRAALAPAPSFGKLLRVRRGAGGFTQVGLACRAQMPVTVLAALERKPRRPDNESTVCDLARGLGLEVYVFIALIDAYVGVRK